MVTETIQAWPRRAQSGAQPKGVQVVGTDPVTTLLEAEAGENPVIVLYRLLNALYAGASAPAEIFVTQAEIEQALETGRAEHRRMEEVQYQLQSAIHLEATWWISGRR